MVFQLVHSITGDGDITYKKYRSSETGMTVVIAGVRGPLVNGYLTFATEAFDDDGIPHTLEHLCFLGSEDYPYKGVLDLMANRCLASGSNAWTDTDHTCYTISNVGSEGFLQILPVYLDHVLYPTLTSEGYVTEVHHINGVGEDAGVVYCEMQGRENTGDSRCHREFVNAIYPGKCGYRSETGGIMRNLRETLTHQKIRDYHASFYRPENLCLIVTGMVDDQQVLDCISKFEQKILNKRKEKQTGPFVRPWQEPVPPFTHTVEKVLQYPCDDDDNGIVYIGWRGPSCVADYDQSVALTLLTDYLNDTAVAPLQQTFVETDDPFCSSVSFSFIENSVSCCYFSFDSVGKDKMPLIKETLFKLLADIANGSQPLDLDRMRSVIHRKKMQLLSSLEAAPHFAAASAVIGEFLYGNSNRDLDIRVQEIPQIDHCAAQGAEFWISLLKKYFVDQPFVHIQGQPSPDLMKKMAEEEKERIAEQQKKLGPSGLEEKTRVLEQAKQKNDLPAPPEVLSNVAIPSTENIYFHQVNRLTNDPQRSPAALLKHVPFRMQIDDLRTNFVTLRVLLNTSDILTPHQRLYLPLICQLLTESAVFRKGEVIPYEDVVRELSNETISAGASEGYGGGFRQLLTLSLKLEQTKYLKGVKWLKELIWETQFQEERVKVVVKRTISDLVMAKRKGNAVAGDLIRSMTYDNRSNDYAAGLFRQHTFLTGLQKLLDKEPEKVVAELKQVRDTIAMDLSNYRVHVSCNLDHLKSVHQGADLIDPWISVFLPRKIRDHLTGKTFDCRPVTPQHELTTLTSSPSSVIAGLGSIESNFMQQCIPSITSLHDADLPAVFVLIQYLTQLEGPMWKQIRGPGLSYHYSISLPVGDGLMFFVLFKSAQLVEAYEASANIVSRHIHGQEKWDEGLLEAARASLIFELIEKQKSIPHVSAESLLNYLKGVEMSYMKDLVAKVSRVSLDDLKRVAPIYLSPLFDPKSARRSVVCKPAAVSQVLADFSKLGIDLMTVNLEDETSLISKL